MLLSVQGWPCLDPAAFLCLLSSRTLSRPGADSPPLGTQAYCHPMLAPGDSAFVLTSGRAALAGAGVLRAGLPTKPAAEASVMCPVYPGLSLSPWRE